MKINKLLTLFSILSLSILPLSCQNTGRYSTKKEIITTSIKNENYILEQQWNNFIRQESISKILNLIFDDDTKKTEFINAQFQLIQNTKYAEEFKKSLIFSNNVSLGFGLDGGFFSERPYILTQSSKFLEEAKSKNWLWLLFNLTKIEFVNFPVFDQFVSSTDETSLEAKKNGMELGMFYTPKSNIFIDYTYKIESIKDYSDTYQFYLLTNEGFILNLNITKYVDNYSWEYSNLINNDGENFIEELNLSINESNDESFKNQVNNILSEFTQIHAIYKAKVKNSNNEIKDYRNAFNNYSVELTKYKNQLGLLKNGANWNIQEPIKASQKVDDEVELFSYIYVYSKVFLNKNKNDIFDIKQYVKNTVSFNDIPHNNETNKIIFNDFYGGRPIRYTFYNIKL